MGTVVITAMALLRAIFCIFLIVGLVKAEGCTRQAPCATSPLSPEYYNDYLKLMQDAGYQLEDSPELEAVHCRPEQDSFQGNGFVNAYGKVNGKMSRIIAYAPGQTLKVHKHDVYELFDITYGAAILTTSGGWSYSTAFHQGYWAWVQDGGEGRGWCHKLVAWGKWSGLFIELVDAETFGKEINLVY
eukprot:TRINITY_DN5656_c0_g1_i1.p1 TRINITY_DN5656_c0_g1~~TRINITY_DN5656_c0_g1_i1.p1  ORF type:complete len:203 (-),score=56.49 TRINITY_DN5656_c0_g1_i1:58-618(-)